MSIQSIVRNAYERALNKTSSPREGEKTTISVRKTMPEELGPAKLTSNSKNLFDAVEDNDAAAIREAVARGDSIEQQRIDGISPLVLAVSLGYVESVQELLALGADPESVTSEMLVAMDYARGRGNVEIEGLLLSAIRRRRGDRSQPKAPGPIVSGVAHDLSNFLDEADLVLPPNCLSRFAELLRIEVGEVKADEILSGLERSQYRLLFEQLFAPEALAIAHLSHGFTAVRSPMTIGSYDVPFAKRRGLSLKSAFAGKFQITEGLLGRLLPDNLFVAPPSSICEIGGAWGATIAYLTDRFKPIVYHNYEPDRMFAEYAESTGNARKMPVDGETLGSTDTASMDLVVANNVLIFTPTIKTYSYLLEMRRVLRPGGVILFNAVISDQIDEELLRHYLETSFPKRAINVLPRDFIDRTFHSQDFEVMDTIDREYCIIRRRK